MKKYDCGGVVSLHDRTHTEFAFELPKWSLVQWKIEDGERIGAEIKYRGKSNFELTESTFHLLMDARQVCANYFMLVEDMLKELKKHGIEIDNTPFKDR